MELFNLLKSFEGLSYFGKLYKIDEMLEGAGFAFKENERKRGKRNIKNYYYIKDGVDYVFCVIHNTDPDIKEEYKLLFTIMDKEVYEKYIEPDENIILNGVIRGMGDVKITLRGNKYSNIPRNKPLHRLAVACENKQVDHKTHNACINIAEYLTPCVGAENCKDKRFYTKVSDNKRYFSVRASILSEDDRIALLQRGYKFKRGRVYSPEYNSADDMYTALNEFESKYLGAFRYNPLIDFTDTWYALILQKMLGLLSDADLYEYNRNYMIANHADIAEYYQLAI